MSTISLLWVGQSDAGARPPEALIGARVERVVDLEAAAEWLAGGGPAPELIVLEQSRPGEFAAALDRLRALAPLARIARVLGSWCEGETRSGRPPGGCTNLYWHAWPTRWARGAARQHAGKAPEWSLATTLSAEERALAAAEFPIERRAGTIAICTRQASSAGALADLCRLGGYTPRVLREGQGQNSCEAAAMIWDADVERLSDADAIASVRTLVPNAPVIALATFPRADDCRGALAAGVAAVIAKPLVIHDLLWELARVAG